MDIGCVPSIQVFAAIYTYKRNSDVRKNDALLILNWYSGKHGTLQCGVL